MSVESKMLFKKKEETVGRKTTSNGVFLDWVARRVMEPKSYSFVSDIITNIIDKKIGGLSIQVEASRQAPYYRKGHPN